MSTIFFTHNDLFHFSSREFQKVIENCEEIMVEGDGCPITKSRVKELMEDRKFAPRKLIPNFTIVCEGIEYIVPKLLLKISSFFQGLLFHETKESLAERVVLQDPIDESNLWIFFRVVYGRSVHIKMPNLLRCIVVADFLGVEILQKQIQEYLESRIYQLGQNQILNLLSTHIFCESSTTRQFYQDLIRIFETSLKRLCCFNTYRLVTNQQSSNDLLFIISFCKQLRKNEIPFKLDLSYSHINSQYFSILKGIPITDLAVNHCHYLTQDFFVSLGTFSVLTKLTLTPSCGMSRYASRMSSIFSSDLTHCLSELRNLPLEELDLGNGLLKDLGSLLSLTRLKSLSFGRRYPVNISTLASLPLKRLKLNYLPPSLNELRGLRSLTSLTSLQLECPFDILDDYVTALNVLPIRQFSFADKRIKVLPSQFFLTSALTDLDLSHTLFSDSKVLSCLTQLQLCSLSINKVNWFNEFDLGRLTKLTTLTHLSLNHCNLSDVYVSCLSHLKLTYLSIEGINFLGNRNLHCFSKMTALRSLVFSDDGIPPYNSALTVLKSLPLEKLTINHAFLWLCARGIRHFGNLKELKLEANFARGQDLMGEIGNLSSLEKLDLSNNATLVNIHVQKLNRCRKLSTLNLCYCPNITSQMLFSLVMMNIEELNVIGTHCKSEDSVVAFMVLPKLRVFQSNRGDH